MNYSKQNSNKPFTLPTHCTLVLYLSIQSFIPKTYAIEVLILP
jgi:hypothetical protein